MELSQLKFAVNTDQLKEAVDLLSEVQKGTASLGKAQTTQEGAAKKAGKAATDVAKGVEAVTVATRESLTALEKNNQILEFMTQGYSKGQASQLTMAKSAGALTDEIKELGGVLQTQRKLMGGDPFDKSISGLTALQNQYTEVKEALRQYNAESELTKNQVRELARDKERLIIKMGIEGATLTEVKEALRAHNKEYVELAANVNRATSAEANVLRSRRELANATKFLANEESRMTSMVASMVTVQDAGAISSERAAQSIARYEQNLKRAGIAGIEAASKLEVYRNQQMQIQKIEEDRQGKFLTRALQPQIGDVAVSLAAGQNPLTVLLQQGDQIRGLIAQTGVQGEALRTVMRNAFTDTIKSVKDTAVAMSSVLGGAFMALGNNVLGLVTGPFTAFKASMDAGATASGSFKDAVAALNVAFIKLVGNPVVASLVAIAVGLTTLGIAAFQVSKQEDALSKSLALSGGSMGLNKESAVAYANSLNDVGVSTSKAIDVMQAMAKEGGFLSKEISLVATTAVKMQKDAGVAIEETVKHFAKLKDKPVDALIELAKASGLISTTSIEAVIALEKQGDKAAAVALAMKISADTQIAQSNRIKTELSSLGEVMNWFSKSWTGMWDAIKGTQYSTPIKEQLQGDLIKTQQEITRVQDNLKLLEKFGIKGDPKLLNQLNATADAFSKQLQDIDAKAAAEKKLTEEQSKGAEVLKDKMRFEKEYKEKQEALDKATYTRQQAINAAIAQEAKLRKAAGGALSASEVATISATAGQEWDKSKASENKKAENKAQRELNESIERYNDILNKSSGYNKEFNDAILSLMIARNAGKRSQEQYNEAVNHLVKQQPFYIQQEKEAAEAAKKRADNQEWLNSVMGRSEGLTKDYTQGTERLMQMLGSGDIDATQFREALDALNKLTPAYKAYESVLANYGKTVADLEAQRKATADEYGMDFKTDEEKAALQSLSKFKKSLADSDADYEKALADAKKFEGSREYQGMIDAAQDVADRRKMIAKDVHDREKYLQSQTYQMYAAGFDALKNLSKSFGEAVGEQFVNFAKTGKSSFEDLTSSFGNMVESMIYDLIKLQIQKQVSGLLDMGISAAVGYFKGSSTTGSSQYALTSGGSGLASMGGGTGLIAQANGGAWNNGVQMYAKGGVFDGPTMFGHSGGLGVLGEAGAEAVMPLKRDANGSLGVAVTGGSSSGSNVEVVINNYGSEKATTTETTDSRGNRKINVTIGEMISGEISRSGSAVQKSMQSTYGQRPQLIRR